MTPQIPGYVIAFESIVRPLVAAIALGLIWIGAARMEAPAQSRYATAGVLTVALIAWLAIAQYLGAANVYFASNDNAVPTILFGLLIPLVAVAVALWLSGNLANLVSAIPLPSIVAAQIYRVAGGIFLLLWADELCPGNSRCPQELATLLPGLLPSLWLRCWLEKRPAPTERFTPGASLKSLTSSWRLRWGQ